MNAELKAKLDAAIERFRDSYPAFTGYEGEQQAKTRMGRANKGLPAILKTFSSAEIEELRKRLEESTVGTYEHYFLTKLLNT